MTIGRVAILTQPLHGRLPCHYCGPCERGCSTGSYFSSQSSTLPAAQATGRLTIVPNSIVHSVLYDAAKNRVTGVRVVDTNTKASHPRMAERRCRTLQRPMRAAMLWLVEPVWVLL